MPTLVALAAVAPAGALFVDIEDRYVRYPTPGEFAAGTIKPGNLRLSIAATSVGRTVDATAHLRVHGGGPVTVTKSTTPASWIR